MEELYLENLINGVEVEPAIIDSDEITQVDGFTIRYRSLENRFEPNFVLFSSKKSTLHNSLTNALVIRACKAIQTQKKVRLFGIPQQQIKLQYADQIILISNYLNNPLTKEQVDEITRWFSTICSLTIDKFSNFDNIIILPSEGDYLATGEPLNGEYKDALKGVILYPEAFRDCEFRTGKIRNLTGVLTHEYFHQYNRCGATQLAKEWSELGGWFFHYEYPKLITGRPEGCRNPQYVESEYGRLASAEEFCDAAVKAFYNRGGFKDPKKLDFFYRNFIRLRINTSTPSVTLVKPQIPEFPTEFTFNVIVRKDLISENSGG
jgi:hypothetical protein